MPSQVRIEKDKFNRKQNSQENKLDRNKRKVENDKLQSKLKN